MRGRPYTERAYKVYEVNLIANDIFNYVGPWSYTHKLIRNKEVFRSEEEYVKHRNEENNFYYNLEKSIREEGLRDPVIVKAGGPLPRIPLIVVPQEIQDKKDDLLICLSMGGSRLWVAQKNNKMIRCIVCDFVERFKDEKELTALGDIKKCFQSTLLNLRYTPIGIQYEKAPNP